MSLDIIFYSFILLRIHSHIHQICAFYVIQIPQGKRRNTVLLWRLLADMLSAILTCSCSAVVVGTSISLGSLRFWLLGMFSLWEVLAEDWESRRYGKIKAFLPLVNSALCRRPCHDFTSGNVAAFLSLHPGSHNHFPSLLVPQCITFPLFNEKYSTSIQRIYKPQAR